jgi:hypothetical protein
MGITVICKMALAIQLLADGTSEWHAWWSRFLSYVQVVSPMGIGACRCEWSGCKTCGVPCYYVMHCLHAQVEVMFGCGLVGALHFA